MTLRPIINRTADGRFTLPADGWYQIVPRGEFPHPQSGKVQVIDDAALTAIANRFNEEASTPNFPGVLIDFDHFSYDTKKASNAAGWIEKMENRADGLYAQVRWTDEGEAALLNGRYRHASPVWQPADVVKLNGNRIRPLRLDSAGLTNSPNLRGMVPLSNREGFPKDPADSKKTETETSHMQQIARALGLSADASEESILAAINQLKESSGTATEMKNRISELEAENKSLTEAQVDGDLDKYANRINPEKKDVWRKQLLANRASTIELLDSLPEPEEAQRGNGKPATPQPLHNRAAAKPPTQQAATAGTSEEKAARAESAVRVYQNSHRVDFDTAWHAVRAENPDLFA